MQREVLQNAGRISAEVAKQRAGQQYELFDSLRRQQEAELEPLEEEIVSIKAVKKESKFQFKIQPFQTEAVNQCS